MGLIMKHYPQESKLQSTRTILPEDKQGMSLEQSDFMTISLQDIGDEPELKETTVQVMPNIVSNRNKKPNKIIKNQKDKEIKQVKVQKSNNINNSKASLHAKNVAHRILDKWGIDDATAAAITATGYVPFDAKKNISHNIRSGRQKKENTQSTQEIWQQTYHAPYQPIVSESITEKTKKTTKSNKKSKSKNKNNVALAVQSFIQTEEKNIFKQQHVAAEIHSANKAVARLFHSQRSEPESQISDEKKPFVAQTHHTISTEELKAVLLPNQDENTHLPTSRGKNLKTIKNLKSKNKIRLPARVRKASATKAVEALRWAVEHNPNKSKNKKQTAKNTPLELQHIDKNEKPFVEQTHHPISTEELQAVVLETDKQGTASNEI